jgi:hypothetical protein
VAELPEVLEAVVLGPEDRLVICVPADLSMAERVDAATFADRFAPGRIMIVAGATSLSALRATKAEGSTVGQCGDMAPTLMFGEREIGSYLSCHLAFGHSGMHSDGQATWTNEGSNTHG